MEKMNCQNEQILADQCFARSSKMRVATSLLIGFHALLRTTEIIFIQASHVTFPQRCGLVLLVLPLTKSGQRLQNVSEIVAITDPLVFAYVWTVVPWLQPGEGLFHAVSWQGTGSFSLLTITSEVELSGTKN